jgi:hypothetical protein
MTMFYHPVARYYPDFLYEIDADFEDEVPKNGIELFKSNYEDGYTLAQVVSRLIVILSTSRNQLVEVMAMTEVDGKLLVAVRYEGTYDSSRTGRELDRGTLRPQTEGE